MSAVKDMLRRHVPRNRATVALRRAACVRPAVPFLWRELRGPSSKVGRYTVRGIGAVVHIRHRTLDPDVLHEVHIAGGYEPPPAAAAALAATAGPLRIVDLGGHAGLFGAWALRRYPGCTVTSFEPDPRNLALLERTRAVNDLAARWQVVPACAGVGAGEVTFAGSGDVYSHVAWPGTDPGPDAIVVPVADALPALCDADLAKIDIEGAEWELLEDPRLADARLRAIVLEFHPLPGGSSFDRVVELLEAAGFAAAVTQRFDEAGLGLAWGWRP